MSQSNLIAILSPAAAGMQDLDDPGFRICPSSAAMSSLAKRQTAAATCISHMQGAQYHWPKSETKSEPKIQLKVIGQIQV